MESGCPGGWHDCPSRISDDHDHRIHRRADSLIVNAQNRTIDWDKVIGAQNGAPDKFSYLRGQDEFRNEKMCFCERGQGYAVAQ